jgi:DNA-directed RNA polymerase specialized sigma24 family protein
MHCEEFANAFHSGYKATCRFLISRGAPATDAEEIAQAAWARGWEHRDQLRNPSLVGFWVNSIARNLFRAKFRAPMVVALEPYQDPGYVMSLDGIELRQMLESCSRRDREMLERILEGYSAEEIGRECGLTSTGVRVRMLRLRQSLREKTAVAA